ncbi:unnamed protein product [Lactuca saligna]|uniref:RNA-dependent RNA polymerase n=1 Tax=Lactuca saligna TaxID=75948 RepID=A0AA35Z5G2_LACSI|nr:unnamed protein product [Lactuca saligna]
MLDSSTEVPLQPSVEELIKKISVEKRITPPDVSARRLLSTITEASAIEILNKIAASSNIRTFSGFIIHMVKASSAGVSSPHGVCSSPHKRSPSPSSASGSPNKYARHVSPNSKQFDSPFSSSNTRTIPQCFHRSPHDDCGSSLSKQITCLKDATPNTTTYHLAESSKATHIVSAQKQLTFSPCSSLKDSNPSNPNVLVSTVSKRLAFSSNSTLDGANSSKGKQHFFDTPNVIYHSPSVQNQQTLLQCSSSKGTFGGPTPGNMLSTPNHSDHTSSLAISLQSLVLDELEFRKLFMVHSYLGRKKLEDVVSDTDAVEIKDMKNLSMIDFEAKLWAKYGRTYCEPCDRAMHLDWDSGKTYLYHCYVSADGTHQFKGPYLNTRRTHLQRVLGDDNVLIVQFTDDPETSDTPSNYCNWIPAYQRISGGISIGLRHYRLFAFKDGRGDNKNPKAYSKKKQVSSWAVKCYFVRKESIHTPWKDKNDPYILFKKTNHEARCLFMHVHMVSNMAKYVSRCSLALSNTIKLCVDLSSVHVERIPDIPCRDENGNVVCDKDGEPLIHTDGTGFISEDLAMLCAKDFIEAKGKHDGTFEFVDLLKLEEESSGSKGTETCIRESPLLVQCRLFKEGYAVKGTLLVNKKLKPRTIQVRPSMIKVEKDSRLSDSDSFSSLEIVSISRRPRKANLSKNLIALLSVGGVPKEYFLGLLETTLQEAQKVSSSMRAAVRVGLNYGQMDDSATSVAMIGSGIPLDEPYLQYRLSILANEERKGLRGGKLPVNESFYLIGTADPTGILNSDEVCIILENGQISGKVLVYRNPGLHFGDIHILNARYVAELEDFVGNAKYGIFFSTKGKRSVGSEIANGDFDGDLYWVSRSPQLLHYFQVSKPWERIHTTPSGPSKKPSDLSYEELETELFTQLFATQKQSIVAGKAADAWLTWMDQYLILGEDDVNNKHMIKEKLLKLVDLYYDALDAPKSGKTVEIPKYLLPEKYPHFLEKNKTYNSSSVLGLIYDTAKAYLPDNASIQDIWKLPCFNVEIPEGCLDLWKKWYSSYRHEMSDAMNSGDESKHDSANIVIKKYKQLLYGTEDFATSSRKIDDIYNEALAIYHVSYDYARSYGDVKKCGFAWKVAGEALCSFHQMKTPGKSIPFKVAVLSMFI